MPLLPHKRRGRRHGGSSRRRRVDDGSSLVGSSDGSSTNSGDEAGASLLSRYRSLLAERLDFVFALRDGVDITDLAADIPDLPSGEAGDSSSHRRLPAPPSCEVVEALTSPAFLEGEMGDALTEYQVYKYLREGTWPEDLGAADVPPGAAMFSVDDDFTYEEIVKDAEKLHSRTTTVDVYNILELDEEMDKRVIKDALYRIKACLLLKGKAVEKLDNAALASMFPTRLIVDNSCFLNFHKPEVFGWHFDPELCQIASLTDYQRLVILNYCDDKYSHWSRYRSHCNTPETDREYLLYWKTITQKIKWVEHCIIPDTSSREWFDIERKAYYQGIRTATDFKNIHFDLARLGIQEFLWRTRVDVYSVKDLDGVFFEIWKRVIKEKNVKDGFAKALKEVYDLKMFPSRERSMRSGQEMAKKVPEPIARQLIAQQVRQKLALTRGYEHYASKKLKVAEYIGLIGRAST